MSQVNFNTLQNIHFIGIGGIGISALARLMLHEKKEISGTNDSESPETLNELREKGVTISLDLDPQHLPKAELYIFSDAWLTNHPEVVAEARSRGVPTLSYFEALGSVANRYYLIVVSGAHGKTTTTAMITDVLEAGGLDPTAVIGSLRAKTKSNFRAGKSKYFVVEADEYMRHFLHFTPNILAITNIDRDHLDYYKDLSDIQSAFKELAEKVPEDGFIICNAKDSLVKPILSGISASLVDYTPYISLDLKLKMPGLHNLMDAALALAVAHLLDIKKGVARHALEEFSGTWRRFEYKGKNEKGALVYDDYAHHPAEIRATLKAARGLFPEKKIVVAFQPHLFSRTKILFEDFVNAFPDADEVLIAPIFSAREKDDGRVSHTMLAEAISNTGKKTMAMTFDDIEKYGRELGNDTIFFTMGAGELYRVSEKITSV